MRELISIGAILIAAVYFITFGAAGVVALESQMHWGLALIAFAMIIIFRLWPALPVIVYLGAHNIWGWPWWVAGGFAFPVCIYIAAHYWTRITDFWHRPNKRPKERQSA